MILGDSLAALLRGALEIGSKGGLLDGWRAALLPCCHRTPMVLALTTFVLLPLCLAKSYANLTLTSVIGLLACLYLACFSLCRYLDGTYGPRGLFYFLAPVRPVALIRARSFVDIFNLRTLVLLSTCGMTFMITTVDLAASLARICVMVSVCFGFPLNFVLLRSELAGALAGRSGAAKGGQHVRLTVVLLAIVASLAVVLQDLGKVQAVSGSILGSFIVFVAPACMKRARRRRRGEQAGGWR
eukprot:CAMPEP_0180690504 /NCGR_PEP_ID=MMETSP1037_2-20121125/75051_1 /TAXON_ID=632150 /ORGANISM="Azadinium spinosum, Strain 3D9" /LENGTH=241 /DNA_ID=CAMNT_0022721419 /DNA_START=60 /DNA_END=783 /DNA_ORIENTATION=-